MPPSANHGAIIPHIYPWFLLIIGFIVFAISKVIIRRWNWIVTLISIIYALYFSLDFYFNNPF